MYYVAMSHLRAIVIRLFTSQLMHLNDHVEDWRFALPRASTRKLTTSGTALIWSIGSIRSSTNICRDLANFINIFKCIGCLTQEAGCCDFGGGLRTGSPAKQSKDRLVSAVASCEPVCVPSSAATYQRHRS